MPARTPNLATRPFVNERLPAVLMALSLAVLAGVTVKHALVLNRLLPSRTAAVEGEVQRLDRELAALRAETEALPRSKPEDRQVVEWQAIRTLVDQRAFSWARLFARLEDVLPPGVRLASIAPTVKNGKTMVEIGAVGRTITDGFDFMKTLEASAEFGDVVPSSVGQAEGGEGGGQIRYRMEYTPPPPPSPAPPSSPDRAAPEGTAPGDQP